MKFHEVIEKYKSDGPKRLPHESFLDYKKRMKLEKLLLKFKLAGKVIELNRPITPDNKTAYSCPTCGHFHKEKKSLGDK